MKQKQSSTNDYSEYENYLDLRDISNVNDYAKLANAGNIIKNGGLVLFPTETVYGLGANRSRFRSCKKNL